MSARKAVAVQRLSQMQASHLDCRMQRHSWHFVTDDLTVNARGRVIEIRHQSLCQGCGSEKTQTFSVPSFELVKTQIKYPDGYLHTGGGRVALPDVRREYFSRYIEGLKEK